MAEDLGSGCPRVRTGQVDLGEPRASKSSREGQKGGGNSRGEPRRVDQVAAKETSRGPRSRDRVQLGCR